MERFEFTYRAGPAASRRVRVGVVGSGDLEVLLEPATADHTTVRVTTSVDGHGATWKARLDRFFLGDGVECAAADVEINDFGATPGVVGLRVAQAFAALRVDAAGEAS